MRPAALSRGPATKPRSVAEAPHVARGDPEQRRDAGPRAARAHAREPLLDQDAVDLVEAHDVGHRAERDEIEQPAEIGLRARPERALVAQARAQRGEHVEHHPDAGEMARGEAAAGLVGIDDDRGRRQRRGGQVMIGHEHVEAARGGGRHALVARNAVVDRDEQPWRVPGRKRDDLGREPVAELEAVRHDEAHVRAERAQPENADGARGGAVGVVVRDDHDALALRDRARETLRRGIDALQRAEARQGVEAVVELARERDAARGVDAREHGRQAAGDQGLRGVRDVAPDDGGARSGARPAGGRAHPSAPGTVNARARKRAAMRCSADGG